MAVDAQLTTFPSCPFGLVFIRTRRKHGEPWFSGTLVIGDPQENVEKSEEQIDVFMFFSGFSGRGFWKIIRAGLPHLFGLV